MASLAAVGDGRTVKLYIDGVLDAESLSYYVFRARAAPSFESFFFTYPPIGSVLRIADDGIEADVDEAIIWNEDRTQQEVRQHMRYGLSVKDIRNGIQPIDPIPANAVDDGNPHRDLISYMVFDGEITPPFVSDMANNELLYRILPSPVGDEILENTRPPISVDRLRALRDELGGYFASDDGGATVENYMQRNDYEFAGLFLGGAAFAVTASPTILDSDGDGLPDWWEILHGLDPGSAEGINGAWADMDGDGLNSRAEYLAGTDPNNWDTDGDGFSDYDSRAGPGDRTWGELYSDGDGIPDDWEANYPSVMSPLLYDAHLDPDGDGWNNYAEWASLTDPSDNTSFPQPDIPVVLRYRGVNHSGPVLWRAYSSARMDGIPDAQGSLGPSAEVSQNIYTVPNNGLESHTGTLPNIPVVPGSVVIRVPCAPADLTYVDDGNGGLRTTDATPVRFGTIDYQTGAWQLRTFPSFYVQGTVFCATWRHLLPINEFPFTGSLSKDTGHFRQTSTWFYAFIDNNGNATWDPNEPAGLAQLQPHDLTYGTMPQIEIGLTDSQPGYGRFSWPAFGDPCCSAYTVSVVNLSAPGAPQVLSRTVRNRTYLHEGDFQFGGVTGGLANAGFQWVVFSSTGTVWTTGLFTVSYPASSTTPTLTSPLGADIVFAKNSFVWTMDPLSIQYRLQIRRTNSSTGQVIFDSLLKAPFDDGGSFKADMPFYAGEGFYGQSRGFDNGIYFWRLQSANPRTTSSFSSWSSFTVNLQEAALGASTISGNAFYFGKVLSTNRPANIVVEAFADFAFSGKPEARIILTNKNALSYKLMGLRPGTYFIRAFIDQNLNKKLDLWESWGFVQNTPLYAIQHHPKAITVPGNAVGQQMIIRDRDTDNDNIPDAWEYLYFTNLATAGPGTDFDGDGLTDLREYEISVIDTDPTKPDTDGDGLTDFFEVTYSDWRWGLPPNPNHFDPYHPVTNPTGTDLDPHRTDTDGDGYSDYAEIYTHGTSPINPLDYPGSRNALMLSDPNGDADGDGWPNATEVVLGKSPFDGLEYPNVPDVVVITEINSAVTTDVVRWRVTTNIYTNIQVRLDGSSNILHAFGPVTGAERIVSSTNAFLGPWSWTNAHPPSRIWFYRLKWNVQ